MNRFSGLALMIFVIGSIYLAYYLAILPPVVTDPAHQFIPGGTSQVHLDQSGFSSRLRATGPDYYTKRGCCDAPEKGLYQANGSFRRLHQRTSVPTRYRGASSRLTPNGWPDYADPGFKTYGNYQNYRIESVGGGDTVEVPISEIAKAPAVAGIAAAAAEIAETPALATRDLTVDGGQKLADILIPTGADPGKFDPGAELDKGDRISLQVAKGTSSCLARDDLNYVSRTGDRIGNNYVNFPRNPMGSDQSEFNNQLYRDVQNNLAVHEVNNNRYPTSSSLTSSFRNSANYCGIGVTKDDQVANDKCFDPTEFHSINYQGKSAPDIINTQVKKHDRKFRPQLLYTPVRTSDEIIPANGFLNEKPANFTSELTRTFDHFKHTNMGHVEYLYPTI